MEWQKIQVITKECVGKILKCYSTLDGGRFIQYEYIKATNIGNFDKGYRYVAFDIGRERWGGTFDTGYTRSPSYYWEPMSDLELVVLGIPFPADYVRESDRT